MKILVLSDSHGNISNIKLAIRATFEVDMIIFLGDMLDDITFIKHRYNTIPLFCVKGNNDFFDSTYPNEQIIKVHNKKIILTHGNLYNVKKGLDKLRFVALSNNADILLFGHTHKFTQEITKDYILLNPGSIKGEYFSKATYATINIEVNGQIFISKFELN